jgi:hypothetical protein
MACQWRWLRRSRVEAEGEAQLEEEDEDEATAAFLHAASGDQHSENVTDFMSIAISISLYFFDRLEQYRYRVLQARCLAAVAAVVTDQFLLQEKRDTSCEREGGTSRTEMRCCGLAAAAASVWLTARYAESQPLTFFQASVLISVLTTATGAHSQPVLQEAAAVSAGLLFLSCWRSPVRLLLQLKVLPSLPPEAQQMSTTETLSALLQHCQPRLLLLRLRCGLLAPHAPRTAHTHRLPVLRSLSCVLCVQRSQSHPGSEGAPLCVRSVQYVCSSVPPLRLALFLLLAHPDSSAPSPHHAALQLPLCVSAHQLPALLHLRNEAPPAQPAAEAHDSEAVVQAGETPLLSHQLRLPLLLVLLLPLALPLLAPALCVALALLCLPQSLLLLRPQSLSLRFLFPLLATSGRGSESRLTLLFAE